MTKDPFAKKLIHIFTKIKPNKITITKYSVITEGRMLVRRDCQLRVRIGESGTRAWLITVVTQNWERKCDHIGKGSKGSNVSDNSQENIMQRNRTWIRPRRFVNWIGPMSVAVCSVTRIRWGNGKPTFLKPDGVSRPVWCGRGSGALTSTLEGKSLHRKPFNGRRERPFSIVYVRLCIWSKC